MNQEEVDQRLAEISEELGPELQRAFGETTAAHAYTEAITRDLKRRLSRVPEGVGWEDAMQFALALWMALWFVRNRSRRCKKAVEEALEMIGLGCDELPRDKGSR